MTIIRLFSADVQFRVLLLSAGLQSRPFTPSPLFLIRKQVRRGIVFGFLNFRKKRRGVDIRLGFQLAAAGHSSLSRTTRDTVIKSRIADVSCQEEEEEEEG